MSFNLQKNNNFQIHLFALNSLTTLKADTSVGTPIYKLRASDADENYPLEFRIFGKSMKHCINGYYECLLVSFPIIVHKYIIWNN